MRGVALAVAVGVAVAACGGGKPAPAKPEPTPRERACGRYGLKVAPFVDRFDAALDAFMTKSEGAEDDAARGDGAQTLSVFLNDELGELRKIDSVDEVLADAHVRMIAALEEVSLSLEQMATGFALGDTRLRLRATDRMVSAMTRWNEATRTIVRRCPRRVEN